MARLDRDMDETLPPPTLLEAAAHWHAQLRDADAEVEQAFARWLETSAEHRLAYADVCVAAFALEQMDAAVPVESTLHGEASLRVAPPRTAPRRPRSSWISRGIGLAASLLVLVLVGGVAIAWLQQSRWQDWTSDASTGTAEVRQLTLDDGSILWLAPDSAIDIRIDSTTRRIDVHRGEVFARVARDTVRPFDIVAGDVVARALGTRYSVAQWSGGVAVAVEEGRVAVRTHGRTASLELAAGQSVQVPRGHAASAPETFDPDRFAWREGLLVLENATLDETLARLDAYLPQRIVRLPPRSDDHRRVTAAIPASDAAAALDAIVADHGLTRHDLAGVVTVIR